MDTTHRSIYAQHTLCIVEEVSHSTFSGVEGFPAQIRTALEVRLQILITAAASDEVDNLQGLGSPLGWLRSHGSCTTDSSFPLLEWLTLMLFAPSREAAFRQVPSASNALGAACKGALQHEFVSPSLRMSRTILWISFCARP